MRRESRNLVSPPTSDQAAILVVTALLMNLASSIKREPYTKTMLNEINSCGVTNSGSSNNHTQGNGVVIGEHSSKVELPQKRKRRPAENGFFRSETSVKPKRDRNKKREAEAEFDAVWICSECKEAECMMKPDAEDLLICDGLCRRLFHYPCAGLQAVPSENESFICIDCKNKKHKCSFCSSFGVDDEDVFKCSKTTCGLFFHESCLAMKNVEVDLVPTAGKQDSLTDEISVRRSFVCPAHCCWTCTQLDLKEQDKDTFAQESKMKGKGRSRKKVTSTAFESKPDSFKTRCLECPIAYHVTCIPPSARFHELATLCHEHAATCRLPELDPEASFQANIERAVEKKFDNSTDRPSQRSKVAHLKGRNKFLLGLSETTVTKRDADLLQALQTDESLDNTNYIVSQLGFCLPCDIKDEVHSKPPNYRHIHALQYDQSNRPPRIPSSDDVCHCVGRCDDDCINKMLYTECFGDSGSKLGATNCVVGSNCGNRQLGQRKAALCKPQREKGKGWGLVTVKSATKGELVHEYIGEVVDEKAKEQRLCAWSLEHPNDPNFYVMALQSGWFIDARDFSNLARFINHSCEPNCSLLQIQVNGRMRCGIFARRDIEPGEYLSYDYHFDTRHGDRFVCCCGSPNCRGTMKGGSAIQDSGEMKSKAEQFDFAKASYERDRKFLAEYEEDRTGRRNQVGIHVPGADALNANEELVSNGPHKKHIDVVRNHRIFLWRNAVAGCDFSSRLLKFPEP